MFVLQKYTVNNLSAVKSITLRLTGPKDKGVDALSIWSYGSTPPWPTSDNVGNVATSVNEIVGVSLNTTTGTVNTPLVAEGSNKTTADTYMHADFTISGDNLTTLKNAANGNTFVLLITNKASEIATSDNERQLYSSGHETVSYRPTLTVTYDAVGVTYGDGIKTNYSSFEAARSAVATAAQDATITVMEDLNITSRVNGIAGKTINIVAGVDGVTLTNTASNSLSFLATNSNSNSYDGTINVGNSDHTLIIKNNSSSTNSVIEVSGSSATAIINIENVTFKDISKTAKAENPDVYGLIKTNGSTGKITLKNVTFDGCSAAGTNEGLVYCNSNGMITVGGDLTFTSCTGHNFRLKGRVEESSFNANQTYTIYNDGIALGQSAVIKMNTSNRDKYTLVNENRCLVPKGSTSNEELVVSEAYTLSVPATNATTLILPFATTIPEGVTAYTLTYTNGAATVKGTQVETTLNANTPVYISATGSESGTKYKFNASTRAESSTAASTDVAEADRTSGALTGVYTSSPITSGYVLSGTSFSKVTESTAVDPYKAYLTATESAPTSLTVNTSGIEYTVTANAAANGTLTVSPLVAGAGETITVTATPDGTYALTALKYNDGSDHDISIETTPYTFVMPAANVTVSATFTAPVSQYTLTIGEMTNGKIQIGEADAATTQYDVNTELTLTAVPANATTYEFDKWTSDGTTELTANADNIISIDGSTMNVKMTKDFTVIATFKEKSVSPTTYGITKADATNGSFTVKVGDSEVTEAASEATVSITATPAIGYEVNEVTVEKTDDTSTKVTVSGEGNTRTFTMPAYAVTVTVTFAKENPYAEITTGSAPTADTYVRSDQSSTSYGSATTMELQTYTKEGDASANKYFYGLMNLTFDAPAEGKIVDKATLRLVTEQLKGNGKINVYALSDAAVTENTKYSDVSDKLQTAIAGTPIASFTAKGKSNTAVDKDALDGNTNTAEAWTNEIDLSEYVKTLTGTSLNIVLMKETSEASSVKFFTKEAVSFANAKDATVTFAGKDIVPVFTVTYADSYTVTVSSPTDNTLTIDKTKATAGETVTITIAAGYTVGNLTVTGSETVTTTKVDDYTYTFTMPAANVTISATTAEITNYTSNQPATADLWVRSDNPSTKNGTGTNFEIKNDQTNGNYFYGMMAFDVPAPTEGFYIEQATLRLTSRVSRGDKATGVYAVDATLNESSTNYDAVSAAIATALATDPQASFDMKGQSKAITDSGLDADYQTLEAWQNSIDLTTYAKSKVGSTMPLLISKVNDTKANSSAFFSREIVDATDDVRLNGTTALTKTDLAPQLIIVYKKGTEATFNVTLPEQTETTEGTIASDKTSGVKQGEMVTLTVTANADYQVESVVVNSSSSSTTTFPVTKGENNTYTFLMPNDNVTVTVNYKSVDYNVTLPTSLTGGEVTADRTAAAKGETVALTVTPELGYELETLTVKDADDNEVATSIDDNAKHAFVMPKNGATVTATFKAMTGQATADGYVRGDGTNTTTTFTSPMQIVRKEGGAQMYGYITFPLSIPEGKIVKSATLRLTAKRVKGDRKINIYALDGATTEEATYESLTEKIANKGEAIFSEYSVKGGNMDMTSNAVGTYSTIEQWQNTLDLTAYLNSLGADATSFGLLFERVSTTTTDEIHFFTREQLPFVNTADDASKTFAKSLKRSDLVPQLTIEFGEVTAVNKTTGVKFATLESAVDAAVAADADAEIEVSADQTLTKRLTWNKAHTLTITPTQDITIKGHNTDMWFLTNLENAVLNIGSTEHSITLDGEETAMEYSVTQAEKKSKLNLTNVKFQNFDLNNKGHLVGGKAEDAIFTLKNLTFSNCKNPENGFINHLRVVNDQVILQGYLNIDGDCSGTAIYALAEYKSDTQVNGRIKVDDENFTASAPITINWASNNTEKNVMIEGITVVVGVKSAFADRFALTDTNWLLSLKGSDLKIAKPVVPTAKIGDTTYADLKAAMEAVQNGQTITLTADQEVSARINVKNMSITIDGGGKKIKRATSYTNGLMFLTQKADEGYSTQLTINNAIIDGQNVETSTAVFEAGNGASTLLSGVTIQNVTTTQDAVIVNKGGGKLTLNNVTFANCTAAKAHVFAGTSNVTLSGKNVMTNIYMEGKNTIDGMAATHETAIKLIVEDTREAGMLVKGGKKEQYELVTNNKDLSLDQTDEGVVIKKETVTSEDGESYATVADAVNAVTEAAEGETPTEVTMTVTSDQEVSARVNVNSKDVTLKADENSTEEETTIKRAENYTNGLIFLTQNETAKLTIENLVLDGQNVEATQPFIENSKGTVVLDGATFKNCVSSSAQGSTVSNKTSGHLTLKDVKFVGCKVIIGGASSAPRRAASTDTSKGIVFVGTNNVKLVGNNTFDADCPTHIYVEKKNRIDGTDATHTAPIKIMVDSNREAGMLVKGGHVNQYELVGIDGMELVQQGADVYMVATTGIRTINAEILTGDHKIYDMRGRKLTTITEKGIYIIDGKKVVVK